MKFMFFLVTFYLLMINVLGHVNTTASSKTSDTNPKSYTTSDTIPECYTTSATIPESYTTSAAIPEIYTTSATIPESYTTSATIPESSDTTSTKYTDIVTDVIPKNYNAASTTDSQQKGTLDALLLRVFNIKYFIK